jgi:hypothetical protein
MTTQVQKVNLRRACLIPFTLPRQVGTAKGFIRFLFIGIAYDHLDRVVAPVGVA